MIHVASLLHDDVIDNAGELHQDNISWHVPMHNLVMRDHVTALIRVSFMVRRR